eukprot:366380-Chlamydomonas_euryale.AAC.10
MIALGADRLRRLRVASTMPKAYICAQRPAWSRLCAPSCAHIARMHLHTPACAEQGGNANTPLVQDGKVFRVDGAKADAAGDILLGAACSAEWHSNAAGEMVQGTRGTAEAGLRAEGLGQKLAC